MIHSAQSNSAPSTEKPEEQGKPMSDPHTLPASWWTSEKIFELEKRAVFYKSWIFCMHASRFKNTGEYFQFNVAGILFFLLKAKDGSIKAFHNICRHRAYPIVKKDRGTSAVLMCKYHGWTYNSDGILVKAPFFDNVAGFKKSENSLFPIHTHVTRQGLVYVNFCNDIEQLIPFDDFFRRISHELDEFDFPDYDYNMSYELKGDFNWKTLMDGYQECYHCPTAHPGLNSAFRMETYEVVPRTRYCRHYAEIVRNPDKEKPERSAKKSLPWFSFGRKQEVKIETKKNPGGEFNGLWLYCFPASGINCYSPAWYSIRVLPIGPTETILHYDIYTKKGLPKAQAKEFIDFLQLVELEDFNLCTLTQKNLNQGIYNKGFLHPLKERGVLYYQGLVRDMVKMHTELEEKRKEIVNPASFVGKSQDVQEQIDICDDIDCGLTGDKSKMEW